MHRSFFVGLVGLFLSAGLVHAQTVTVESLLDEMLDRDSLARLPNPAYTCRQASSYDRKSVGSEKPDWFANADRSQFVRVEKNGERTEYVLMDEDGPGAIVRFWATWHGPGGGKFSNGTLRFYLDNQTVPAIEGPMEDIMDKGGLVGPPLAEGVSPKTNYDRRGHNLYLPIPYATRCKVTYETSVTMAAGVPRGSEALYYQINYRTYEQGTEVQSFSLRQLRENRNKIEAVQKRLTQSRLATTDGLKTVLHEECDMPGKTLTAKMDGPGAIHQISVKLDAANLAQALRSTVVTMEFDGAPTVWVPVGDFFGLGYRVRPYHSWYTEAAEDGTLSCYWTMPFKESCRISLTNFGDQPVKVAQAKFSYGDWTWDDRSMHFHATWYQLTKQEVHRGEGGAIDVTYVHAKGQGVLVGDTLTIFNGADAWWGEGDEKIFVDGEPFPSHFGTGTEDYYGYAWCRPEYFQSPFHAQPCGDGNLRSGFSVNSRYRALDAIPFNKEIKFDMELWHWADTVVNYAPATFWYARPGATSNVQPDVNTVRMAVALDRRDVVDVFLAKNAVEGEAMQIVSKTGGTDEIQRVSQFRWSHDGQLWWRDGKPGDQLVLRFSVPKAGRYQVLANLTKAPDYGVVQVQVNDHQARTFDRYHQQVAHDKLDLGTFDLAAGPNRLTVAIVGANEKAVKKYMFGLDYLQLNQP